MRIKEKHLVILIFIVLSVLFVVWSLKSSGSHAGADDLHHTQIAKYSWKYPRLLLDHWGKPFYTLVASPFAQFGNTGTKMMNVLFALLSAFLVYAAARKLRYQPAWAAIFMVLFAPIYTVLALSGNIEILAGLIAVASVYYYSRDKFIAGNIILSFGFFVRNEMFVFIPFFLIYCILQKKYRAIPFIFTGFILFSIAGYFYYHDIFWVITKIPYGSTKELVGTGSLLHYLNASKVLFGIPETVLMVIGLVMILIQFFRNKLTFEKINSQEIFLIVLPFLAYFGGHSYLHWKGAGGSGGAMRVMASIIPLSALIAMKGLSTIYEFVKKQKTILSYLLVLIILFFIIITPKKIYSIPVPDFKDMALLRKAADWYKHSEYYGSYLIYGDERIPTLLNMDPFSGKQGRWYLHDSEKPEKYIPNGSVAIWDAHFSTNFNHIELDVMMNSKYYRLIKIFEPEIPFKVRGDYDYAIYFFQKQSGDKPSDNYKILEQLRKDEEESYRLIKSLDFEDETTPDARLSEISYSGNYAYKMGNDNVYSPTITLSGKDILQMEPIPRRIKASVMIRTDSLAVKNGIILVASLDHKKKTYDYFTSDDPIPDTVPGWYTLEVIHALPSIHSKKDIIKVYVWNKGNQEFIMDNLNLFAD